MSIDAARQAKHSGRRGGGWTGIAAAVICGLLAAAGGAEELSEEEQLDLLEKADDYVFDRDRDTDTAIALYMEVLEKVDLDPRIRLEIELQVGHLHFFQARGGERDLPTALAWYEAIIDRYPVTEPDVFDALGNRAHVLSEMDRDEEAEVAYLETRQTYLGLPEEQKQRLEGKWSYWNINTLNHLIMHHGAEGVEGVPGLRRLKDGYPGDQDLVREVSKAIDILETARETLAPYEDKGVDGLPDLFEASRQLQEVYASEKITQQRTISEARSTELILQPLVGAETRRITDRIGPSREEIRELLQDGAISVTR